MTAIWVAEVKQVHVQLGKIQLITGKKSDHKNDRYLISWLTNLIIKKYKSDKYL